MPLPEELQALWRRRFVVDALVRIGGLVDPPVEPIRAAPRPLGYRNRVELVLGAGPDGSSSLGLHARHPEDGLVDVERCLLQDRAANAVLSTIRSVVLPGTTREDRQGHRVLIRRSEATGEILVGLWECGSPFPDAIALTRRLMGAHPEVSGVVRIRAAAGGRAGARTEALAGRDWIEERVAGLCFRLPATSFLQVSAEGAEALSALVEELVVPRGISLLDLYCGVGVHALRLVARGLAGSATGVDSDRQAVACGRDVALREGLAVDLVPADVARFLSEAPGKPDLVVANPPRAGMGRAVALALGSLGARAIVIVSCEPTTLARDLRTVLGAGPYRLSRVVPVDLFPQTAHVETVALLERV